jgi:polyisoprenoid-binding protein YceI
MSISSGTHALGPDNGTLLVKTTRTGAVSKAGHDLTIEVTSWDGTLDLKEDPAHSSVELRADGTSLRVLEGKGGIQALGDKDKESIRKSIDKDVLRRTAIEFRSTDVEVGGGGDRFIVRGDLQMRGKTAPVAFELAVSPDGHLTGSAMIKQSAWGIKQFSILFGTLKVADEVEVVIDARLNQ